MSRKDLLTLSLIRSGGKVLLGSKKKDSGKWQAFEGKTAAGETIHEAAIRELKEQTGLIVKKLNYIGVLYSKYSSDPKVCEQHIFTTNAFHGGLITTEEMELKWFSEGEIPYSQMGPLYEFWFPLFLKDAKFKGYFYYKDDETLDHYSVKPLDENICHEGAHLESQLRCLSVDKVE